MQWHYHFMALEIRGRALRLAHKLGEQCTSITTSWYLKFMVGLSHTLP